MVNTTHAPTRCKPGDIAVFVRGRNLGKLVHIDRRAYDGEFFGGSYWWRGTTLGPVWFVSSLSGPLAVRLLDDTIDPNLHMTIAVEGAALRPLRNPRGSDQTLRWASVPQRQGETSEIGRA